MRIWRFYYNPTLKLLTAIPFMLLVCLHTVCGMLTVFIYLVVTRNRAKGGRIRTLYAEHFGKTCSKSLSCMEVCPMKIPTLASMGKLNGMKR